MAVTAIDAAGQRTVPRAGCENDEATSTPQVTPLVRDRDERRGRRAVRAGGVEKLGEDVDVAVEIPQSHRVRERPPQRVIAAPGTYLGQRVRTPPREHPVSTGQFTVVGEMIGPRRERTQGSQVGPDLGG
jgi:hypothetical protein